MATAPKTFSGGTKPSFKNSPSSEQLRHDRITAIIALVIVAALMGLIIWLASQGNGTPNNIDDYWPIMMP